MNDDDRLRALVELTEAFEQAMLDAGETGAAAVWMMYLPLLVRAWRKPGAEPALYDLLTDWRYGDLVARFRQEL